MDLAAAGGADDGAELTRGDLKCQVSEGGEGAAGPGGKSLVDAAQLDDGLVGMHPEATLALVREGFNVLLISRILRIVVTRSRNLMG